MAKSLKILQIPTYAVYGGLSLHVLTLSKGLKARGHEVTVLSMCDGPLIPEFKSAEIPVSAVPYLGQKARRDPLLGTRVIYHVGQFIKETAPDIVHTHGPRAHFFAGVASRFAGRPVLVASAHGSFTQFACGHANDVGRCRRGWKKFQYGAIDKLVAHLADCMVAVCNATAKELVDKLGITSSKVVVVYNGIEEQYVSQKVVKERRLEFDCAGGRPLIAYVGRIAFHKGCSFLIEAMRQVVLKHPDARLVMVGEGPMAAELERYSREGALAGKVIMAGSRADAIAVIAASDVVVLPSLSEGLPLSLLEAAMLKRPMIATKVGGMPEVVLPGETGLLTPLRDAGALADAILQLLDDSDARQRMGAAARKLWEEEFTAEKMVDRMESLYKDLLAARATARAAS